MSISRRTFLKGTAGLLAAVGLPGWAIAELTTREGGLSSLGQHILNPPPNDAAGDSFVHLLNRMSFGPTQASLAHARSLGVDKFLDEQLHPEQLDDSNLEQRLAKFTTLKLSGADLLDQQPKSVVAELQQATVLRAMYSTRQLQEVLVDFWGNHFNISVHKHDCKYLKTADDRDVIRPHVLGRFRDLLGASAKSPAMLDFLDNRFNMKGAPNENYGRELMELHTISIDGGYSEQDVEAVARCFTGWTVADGAFKFRPAKHDDSAKTVLGTALPAGRGIEDGEQVLDILARHPSTAHFIALKLCRYFVSDTPSDGLVSNVASVFQQTDGDLRTVVRAILTSPEFAQAQGQKFHRPFDFVIAAARAVGAETDGAALVKRIAALGQPLFAELAPPGYSDVTGAWMNTAGLLGRWNYALALPQGKMPGTMVNADTLLGTASDATSYGQRIVDAVMPGHATTDLPKQLASLLGGQNAPAAQVARRAPVAVGLLLAAPAFQWR